MVKSISNFGRSGLADWVIQRATAVVLAAYTLFIVSFVLMLPEGGLTYDVWTSLFSTLWVKIFTLLTLLSIVGHAWVGLWTVLTDYCKPTALRFLLLALLFITLFVYLIAGVSALWGL